MPERDPVSSKVLALAIEVHRILGPGLLESVYEECLCHELSSAGIEFHRQKPLPVVYKGIRLDCGLRIDILLPGKLVVEIKSVAALLPIHDAQLLTYLRLSGIHAGLLLNFNTALLKDGIKRLVV